jgi:hypothetical protein
MPLKGSIETKMGCQDRTWTSRTNLSDKKTYLSYNYCIKRYISKLSEEEAKHNQLEFGTAIQNLSKYYI